MPRYTDDTPPFPGSGEPEEPEETLELDLSEQEQALASRAIAPGGPKSKDSTHALEEPPARQGASIGAALRAHGEAPLLEPMLAGASDPDDGEPAGLLPPPCLARLAAGAAADSAFKVVKEGPQAWSLAAGGSWPVYVRRRALSSPASAPELAELARVARRWGGGRLCLSPQGDLDIFFNDRESFLQAGAPPAAGVPGLPGGRRGTGRSVDGTGAGPGSGGTGPTAGGGDPGGVTGESPSPGPGSTPTAGRRPSGRRIREDAGSARPARKGGPSLMSRCRGLLFCPNAAVDTLGAADLLLSILREDSPPSKTPLSVSIHGCPAGSGFDCGVYEYTDLRIVGRRSRAPIPDQELLALSPRIRRLVEDCPSGALAPATDPGRILDLDEHACVKCGACLARDPSFHWPSPLGSYLTLELSGRRAAPPRAFLAPRVLVERSEDQEGLFRRIAGLVALFRREGLKNEILSDFMDRTGLRDYFAGDA
ncbi:MAG: hypothetical protein LBG06_06470 [Deltaproteobacteria bacterium]|jgi:dissimilatory sulfite reductase (desulfoviridin) alpha/beta subunit|nr:hypothetical protein [Deltaproteobacteria bacterium]